MSEMRDFWFLVGLLLSGGVLILINIISRIKYKEYTQELLTHKHEADKRGKTLPDLILTSIMILVIAWITPIYSPNFLHFSTGFIAFDAYRDYLELQISQKMKNYDDKIRDALSIIGKDLEVLFD
jgi:uncharacterized membrane protein